MIEWVENKEALGYCQNVANVVVQISQSFSHGNSPKLSSEKGVLIAERFFFFGVRKVTYSSLGICIHIEETH